MQKVFTGGLPRAGPISQAPSLQCAIYNTKTVFMLKMGSFSVMIPVDGSDNSENAFNCK